MVNFFTSIIQWLLCRLEGLQDKMLKNKDRRMAIMHEVLHVSPKIFPPTCLVGLFNFYLVHFSFL